VVVIVLVIELLVVVEKQLILWDKTLLKQQLLERVLLKVILNTTWMVVEFTIWTVD
jgi:hypothetical protein